MALRETERPFYRVLHAGAALGAFHDRELLFAAPGAPSGGLAVYVDDERILGPGVHTLLYRGLYLHVDVTRGRDGRGLDLGKDVRPYALVFRLYFAGKKRTAARDRNEGGHEN